MPPVPQDLVAEKLLGMRITPHSGLRQNPNVSAWPTCFAQEALAERPQEVAVVGRVFGDNEHVPTHWGADSIHPSANSSSIWLPSSRSSSKRGISARARILVAPDSASRVQTKVVLRSSSVSQASKVGE